MVKTLYLRLERDVALVSRRASRVTNPAHILLDARRGDRHCCVDLVL